MHSRAHARTALVRRQLLCTRGLDAGRRRGSRLHLVHTLSQQRPQCQQLPRTWLGPRAAGGPAAFRQLHTLQRHEFVGAFAIRVQHLVGQRVRAGRLLVGPGVANAVCSGRHRRTTSTRAACAGGRVGGGPRCRNRRVWRSGGCRGHQCSLHGAARSSQTITAIVAVAVAITAAVAVTVTVAVAVTVSVSVSVSVSVTVTVTETSFYAVTVTSPTLLLLLAFSQWTQSLHLLQPNDCQEHHDAGPDLDPLHSPAADITLERVVCNQHNHNVPTMSPLPPQRVLDRVMELL
eukprot:364369-Chlamydomonas_euryale.AAC.6